MLKRIGKALLIACMLVTGFGSVSTAVKAEGRTGFTDIDGHWAADWIGKANAANLLEGYEDGTFRPDGSVTRAEFAAFLSRTTKRQTAPNAEQASTFGDINGHWSKAVVNKAMALGFINASDYVNGFEPDKPLTRYEMAKWMANGLAHADGDYKQALADTKGTLLPIPEYYTGGIEQEQIPYVALVMGTGLMEGFEDGSFRLTKTTTRAEVCVLLQRYLNVESKKASEFLGLKELREVGTTGTNLLSLTKYTYGKDLNKNIASFDKIVGKPITMRNGIGTLKIKRLIVVDASSTSDFKGLYGSMFIDSKFNDIYNDYYNIFIEMSFTPLIDGMDILGFSNGTSSAITNGYRIENSSLDRYGITTLPFTNVSQFFEKGIEKNIWVCNKIARKVRPQENLVLYSAIADTGSETNILLIK
ncbi:S-layer homology domain-containing protein [Paenibacillus sp. MBLB4367]|uniref:S-layer homology domain-containing protein n=1 Tax=Paenibacillus sp. MBLB4367 TaxID=3384767 RepID=UPI003907F584